MSPFHVLMGFLARQRKTESTFIEKIYQGLLYYYGLTPHWHGARVQAVESFQFAREAQASIEFQRLGAPERKLDFHILSRVAPNGERLLGGAARQSRDGPFLPPLDRYVSSPNSPFLRAKSCPAVRYWLWRMLK